MASYGYGSVAQQGFVGLYDELESGAWGDIPTRRAEADGPMAPALLLEGPRMVVWKMRLTQVIRGLLGSLGVASAGVLKGLDDSWDGTQRRLFFSIAAEGESKSPERKAAATRLGDVLLLGGGTAQTQLSYDEEVDFGREQLRLTRAEQPLGRDARLLGLEPVLAEIAETTEALAKGLGRGQHQRATPRSVRLRQAQADCVSTFNAVHEDLDWVLDHLRAGKERDLVMALRAPLLALLDRYPTGGRPPAASLPAGGGSAAPAAPGPTSPPA